MAKRNASAAPAAAGYLFQAERALALLSVAAEGAVVAVEYVDDLSVHRGGHTLLQEQDKHTLTRQELLSDRSRGLWRTFQIWLEQREAGFNSDRYVLVTNAPTDTPVCAALKFEGEAAERAHSIVSALRLAGTAARSSGPLQNLINSVLGRDEQALLDLATRVELVDANYAVGTYSDQISNGFAFDPNIDQATLAQSLLGWVISTLMSECERDNPGLSPVLHVSPNAARSNDSLLGSDYCQNRLEKYRLKSTTVLQLWRALSSTTSLELSLNTTKYFVRWTSSFSSVLSGIASLCRARSLRMSG